MGGGLKCIIMKKQLVHTFEDIINIENLLEAWNEFIRGKRNKSDVQEFSLKLIDNLFILHEDLCSINLLTSLILNQETSIKQVLGIDCYITRSIEYFTLFSIRHSFPILIPAGLTKAHIKL
ncbi:MAG: hypothetical protein UU78_C0060G0001 [Candidatus Roizmanbacteria bacterium GW2011_GWC2_41_7]|uniref:Uncharacterized protein n=1 Tax=Candidatus Roizmanbacteria bacterium GW2011_GWC2_41_7 TaxID=1618487 RepID=A0A0G0ZEP2_9BACT|nr:MAG: hypothetical protein UU78_C0060G0001 [Candidatus Roizmanbacteria bacterium GW2011_GWC2_41_7]